MPKVYFTPVGSNAAESAVQLLKTLMEQESVPLSAELPLKVHFGEKGNRTYLKPEMYDGLIDFLQSKGVSCRFSETSVLYGGERFSREKHLKLAESHGFTRIPVSIEDGANGEEAVDVPVNLRHFKKCAVAKGLAEAEQILVCSHFKGHKLAGFGGAVKQLSMGCAAKGGKMAMHLSVKPRILKLFCKHCGLCAARCQVKAITITKEKAEIDRSKCIGCGACFSICRHHAVSILSFAGFRNMLFGGKYFREKLVEYAYAAHKGKKNIYLNFALSVTNGCDCEPLPMRACIADIGIFASLDPVAVDQACLDAAEKAGKKFRGGEQLEYAEKIGLGSRNYELIDISMKNPER